LNGSCGYLAYWFANANAVANPLDYPTSPSLCSITNKFVIYTSAYAFNTLVILRVTIVFDNICYSLICDNISNKFCSKKLSSPVSSCSPDLNGLPSRTHILRLALFFRQKTNFARKNYR